MPLDNWELRVWSPTGAGPRIISRDESYIRSTGLRMQLTPEGDCREASFEAKGSGLGLRPLDCVQIVYGGTPLYYGELRDGGNVRDVNGHGHTLRSLVLALKEVTLSPSFSTPQQPAHLTVQAVLADVTGSGALGSPPVIEFDAALCPDLGFDCRAVVDAHQQTAWALLDRIAQDGAGYGVSVRFGVRPDRKFFCRAATTNALTLDPGQLTSTTQWRAPVAEAPVTAVLWYVAQAEDKRWLTHLSRSAETALYRDRVRPVSLTTTDGLWNVARLTYAVDPDSTFVAYLDAQGRETDSQNPQAAEMRLTDNATERALMVARAHTYTSGSEPGQMTTVYNTATSDLTVTATATEKFDRVWFNMYGYWEREVTVREGWFRLEHVSVDVDISIGDHLIHKTLSESAGAVESLTISGQTIEIRVPLKQKPGAEYELRLFVQELRAERYDRALLNRLAQHYYHTPALEPADIELRQFIAPTNLSKYVTLGDYQSIVDAWEYRLSAARGLLLGCLAGQAEDPAALAQADLIKARDGQAVITAITSSR